jgi:hypothetical protein
MYVATLGSCQTVELKPAYLKTESKVCSQFDHVFDFSIILTEKKIIFKNKEYGHSDNWKLSNTMSNEDGHTLQLYMSVDTNDYYFVYSYNQSVYMVEYRDEDEGVTLYFLMEIKTI